jgi:hypothetical protein
MLGIENHIGVAGMIERGEFPDLGMPVTPNLDSIAIGLVNHFLCGDLAYDVTLSVCLLRNQTSKFVFRFNCKRIHRNHFEFLSSFLRLGMKSAMHWEHYTTILNDSQLFIPIVFPPVDLASLFYDNDAAIV